MKELNGLKQETDKIEEELQRRDEKIIKLQHELNEVNKKLGLFRKAIEDVK